jgi:hypothetical protein
MKLKDAMEILKKNDGNHINQVYIPSLGRKVMFSQLTTADVKTLTRNNVFDEFDLNVELLKLSLFDKLCHEDLKDEHISSHTITQLDYLSFLIGIRQLLNNTLSYTFTCRKCDHKFKHTIDLAVQFDDDITNFKPQYETLELVDENGHVYKFELTNFTMEEYLYYRYVMTRLQSQDSENPDVINESKFTRPILYIKRIFIDDEEIEDWTSSLFPTKLDLINRLPPQITFGEPKDNDTNLTNFIADTFAEEILDRKIRNMEVVCPECKHAYRGIFNFDGFFTF